VDVLSALRVRLLTVAVIGLVLAGCSSTPDGIRTVADFDKAPCQLFTDDVASAIVAAPYQDLAQVKPNLIGTKASATNNDTYACTYSFVAASQPAVPQVASMTVTVAHSRSGSQPFALCSAGAQTKAAGYRTEKIGDEACLTPTSDLWLKIAANYYHVVAVPQPGFTNPVEASVSLSPLLLTVADGVAQRMPKA
jgi:hypothetical protein